MSTMEFQGEISISWFKVVDKEVKENEIVIFKGIRKISEKLHPLQKKKIRGPGGKTIERL